MQNSAEQIIIHNAKEMGDSRFRSHALSIAVFTYTQNSKMWMAVFAGNLRHRYTWQPKATLLFKREIKTLAEAESFVRICLEEPQKNIPLSEISNGYIRNAILRQLDHLAVLSDIDGTPINHSDWLDLAEKVERRELEISLALGQSLVATIADKKPIPKNIKSVLRFYIEHVPLVIGHWGPFKRILKILEEMPEARSLYGVALARIDAGVLDGRSDLPKIEDLGFFLPLFDAPVASPKTLSYLARRGRRVLRRLSKTDPEQYADCAEAFLAASDNLGNRVNLERRRVLAEVLYGRGALDASHGRGAILLPPEPSRHRRRWDRSPEIWNARVSNVAPFWSHSQNIPDIQIWAFNVLKSRKEEIPALGSRGLRLALISPSDTVRRRACDQIAGDPSSFIFLDQSSAISFLNFSSESQFQSILPVIEEHPTIGVVQESISRFLNENGLIEILRGERAPALSARVNKLLGFALRHQQTTFSETELLSLALYIGETNGFRPAALWSQAFSSLPLRTLIEIRLQLTGLSSAAQRVIDKACRKAIETHPDEDIAMALVHSPTAALRELAWSILTSEAASSTTLVETWKELANFAESKDGMRRLQQCVLNRSRFETLLNQPDQSFLLGQIAIALAECDHKASKRALSALAKSDDAEAILQTLEKIAVSVPDWPWATEKTLLRNLIIKGGGVRDLFWKGLAEGHCAVLVERLRSANDILDSLPDVIRPEDLVSISSQQAELLVHIFSNNPTHLTRSKDLSIAAATCPMPDVSALAISILEARDKIRTIYVPLLESRLPAAMLAAKRYLANIKGRDKLTKAIVSVCDSAISDARAHGLEMLRERRGEYDAVTVYSAISEHKSPEVAAEVASYALHDGQINKLALQKFDQRVLRTRRHGRRAKDLVKQRLSQKAATDEGNMGYEADVSEERIHSLLAMARGRSLRDREWALLELVRLTELGLQIPHLEVSKTTA